MIIRKAILLDFKEQKSLPNIPPTAYIQVLFPWRSRFISVTRRGTSIVAYAAAPDPPQPEGEFTKAMYTFAVCCTDLPMDDLLGAEWEFCTTVTFGPDWTGIDPYYNVSRQGFLTFHVFVNRVVTPT